MQRKNWWVPMVATVAIFSLVDVSLGDDNENPSKVKSKDNPSKSESRDDNGPGRNDTDRMIASGLGCLDAAEVELARFAAGKANVNAVNTFLRHAFDKHLAMLGQMREFAPDAGNDVGQSASSNDANVDQAQPARFNWHQVMREVANENLRVAKKELRNQSGLGFDWAIVWQQKMIHEKMASSMKVLRKYASPELRTVIDDELADVKQCQSFLDDLIDLLKDEGQQRYRNGNRPKSQVAGSMSGDVSSTLPSDSSSGETKGDTGYVEESAYSETAFIAVVRLERGSSGRARLGVTFRRGALNAYTDQKDECEIASVRSGGPADKAGIEPGDVILAINGNEIDSVDDLRQILTKFADGNRVQLAVERKRAASVRIPLGAAR